MYCIEFHTKEITQIYLHGIKELREIFEKMPAMESISRCKRKLAKTDDMFRPDKKEVIESRLNQTNEILESVKD